jgi:hypothetical protein
MSSIAGNGAMAGPCCVTVCDAEGGGPGASENNGSQINVVTMVREWWFTESALIVSHEQGAYL